MSANLILLCVVLYFGLLMLISWLTSRGSTDQSFFIGNRRSPWFLVAFGMIGASLSGVTFMSVPGEVGGKSFYYMQTVMGYLLGYFVIATVLLPLYYRLGLTSIYTYLNGRFGPKSYKTGAFFFLLSRIIGASFRIYLVVIVLQDFVFGVDPFHLPFWVTVLITITLIYLYTFRAGIKTIVWTDSLQTLFMLVAVGLSIFFLMKGLNFNVGDLKGELNATGLGKIFFWDASSPMFFWKQFLGGALIAIVMTGLDQDMMQKNLSCKNLKDAQKNMASFSVILFFVNFLILVLGALFMIYAAKNQITAPERTDQWFATIALNHLPVAAGITFIIGLIAAAFSSADSALTSLTTSFCIDFLGFEKSNLSDKEKTKRRKLAHVLFAIVLYEVVCLFYIGNNRSVISQIFVAASITYGPILALFAMGILTNFKLRDRFVPIVSFIIPTLSFLLWLNSKSVLGGYQISFAEILALNGLLTFLGYCLLIRGREKKLL